MVYGHFSRSLEMKSQFQKVIKKFCEKENHASYRKMSECVSLSESGTLYTGKQWRRIYKGNLRLYANFHNFMKQFEA